MPHCALLLGSSRSHAFQYWRHHDFRQTRYHRIIAPHVFTGKKKEWERFENITSGSGKRAYETDRAVPRLSHTWQPELKKWNTRQWANSFEPTAYNTAVRKEVLTCYFRDCEGIGRVVFAENGKHKKMSFSYMHHHQSVAFFFWSVNTFFSSMFLFKHLNI